MMNAYFYKINENPLPKTTHKQVAYWIKNAPAILIVFTSAITTAVLSVILIPILLRYYSSDTLSGNK